MRPEGARDAVDGFRTGAFLDANVGDTATCGSGVIGDIQHSCNGIGGRGQAYSVAGNTGLLPRPRDRGS